MNSDFYSFADAFEEASSRQGKKYSDNDSKKAALDQVRRQFRSFLAALSIEYSSLKHPKQLSNFRDEEDSNRDDVVAEYITHCKNVAYSFNSDGFIFAVDFICNWKNREFKRMRKRKFFLEEKAKYQEIISAIKSNMDALGYSSEKIFQQECMFWHNIASHSSYNVLDFLDISTLLGRRGKLREISNSLSGTEEDDLIYVNNLVCQDYIKFQEKWLLRIEKALQYRCDFANKVSSGPDVEDFLKLISTGLCSGSLDDDFFSSIDLKSQEKLDAAEIEFLHERMDLILTVANCINTPKLEKPIGSEELYDQILEEELLQTEKS